MSEGKGVYWRKFDGHSLQTGVGHGKFKGSTTKVATQEIITTTVAAILLSNEQKNLCH